MLRIHFPLFAGTLSGALVAVAFSTASASAQDARTIVDRVYAAPQADRGEQLFRISCSSCHAPDSFGGGAFAERWSGQTLGDVFDFVSNTMPENEPGGLKKEEYVDILAFILRTSEYPAGNDELPVDGEVLKKLQIAPNPK